MTLLASDPALWDVVFQESSQRARFVQRLLGPKGARVLYVGCATGNLCALLSLRGARVTGVDINAKMIEAAGAKDRGNGGEGRAFAAVLVPRLPIVGTASPDCCSKGRGLACATPVSPARG